MQMLKFKLLNLIVVNRQIIVLKYIKAHAHLPYLMKKLCTPSNYEMLIEKKCKNAFIDNVNWIQVKFRLNKYFNVFFKYIWMNPKKLSEYARARDSVVTMHTCVRGRQFERVILSLLCLHMLGKLIRAHGIICEEMNIM